MKCNFGLRWPRNTRKVHLKQIFAISFQLKQMKKGQKSEKTNRLFQKLREYFMIHIKWTFIYNQICSKSINFENAIKNICCVLLLCLEEKLAQLFGLYELVNHE